MKMGSNNPEGKNSSAGALLYPANSQESVQLVPVQQQSATIAGALTFPTSDHVPNEQVQSNAIAAVTHPACSRESESAPRVNKVQPRTPRNLQGLLKFAMEATQAEDAPGNLELTPMDEQRRQFLEDALRSLTVNVTEVLDNAIKVLTNLEKMNSIQLGESLPDEVKNAFTILLDYVDDLDVANDFYKMGGFAMFPICYSSKNEEVRARTSSVLGTLCQNNPFCQTRALDCGLLHVLLNLVQSEQGNALAKCLYAISCASRGYEPAGRELIAQGGCQILMKLLSSSESAARTKAAFLIRYYCEHFDEARKQFIRHNIVNIIAEQLQAGRDETSEHLLSILQVLVSGRDAAVLSLCRDSRYNLKKVLEDHLKRPDLKDDRFREEKEYCNELLVNIFGSISSANMDTMEEKADR